MNQKFKNNMVQLFKKAKAEIDRRRGMAPGDKPRKIALSKRNRRKRRMTTMVGEDNYG